MLYIIGWQTHNIALIVVYYTRNHTSCRAIPRIYFFSNILYEYLGFVDDFPLPHPHKRDSADAVQSNTSIPEAHSMGGVHPILFWDSSHEEGSTSPYNKYLGGGG